MAAASSAAVARRPARAVRVILGHICPVRVRVELPLGHDRSWTGGQIWPSALTLADWLARCTPVALMHSRVLELGCGAAPLPSAVAALCGAAEVTATDGDESAVLAADSNLERSCASAVAAGRLRARRLEWGEALSTEPRGSYEVVLFADGVYTEDAAKALAACIDHCLCPEPSAGIVYGAIGNTRVGAADFCREMQRRGFVATALELGPSADALATAVEAFEGCTREEALQTGPCRMASWRRRDAFSAECRDDGEALARHFDRCVAVAEMDVESRLREAGYEPSE